MLDLLDRLDRLERRIDRLLPEETSSPSAGAAQFQPFADDFQGFAALLDIVDKNAVRGKLRPNAIQAAFEVTRSGRDIVLKPRQVGFTTWELARDVWYFLTKPGSTVVVVVQSQSEHNALNEISEKLRVMFESLEHQGYTLGFRSESRASWAFGDSKLRIVEAGASSKAASKKGRGGTIHRLHISEAAFYEHAETTLNALLECVPPPEFGSEVCIESTANGASGVYYERYQRAKAKLDGYAAKFFRWLDHAEYATPLEPGEVVTPLTERERQLVALGGTPEQLKWYRGKVADKKQDLVDQEYPLDEETCWLVAGRLFFDRARIVALKSLTREPVAVEYGDALRIFAQPVRGREYLVIADPSEGMGGDPGAAIVVERATLLHIATLHGQFPVGVMAELLAAIGAKYNYATVVVERNNHGAAVLNALARPPQHVERGPYQRIFKDRDGKAGWHTGEISRAAALDALEDAIRAGSWVTPDAQVVAEFLTFVIGKNGKAEAASGAHDDLVMVAAIAQAVGRRALNYRHEEYA